MRSSLIQVRKGSHDDVNVLAFQFLNNVQIGFLSGRHAGMSEAPCHTGDGNAGEKHERCMGMPLRYNNDKQKKPLFSRGLSVCRLLFNSFSKLKIDENYKEKRRLFY